MAGMQYGHWSLYWGKELCDPSICEDCGKSCPIIDFGDKKKYVCDDCEISWRV